MSGMDLYKQRLSAHSSAQQDLWRGTQHWFYSSFPSPKKVYQSTIDTLNLGHQPLPMLSPAEERSSSSCVFSYDFRTPVDQDVLIPEANHRQQLTGNGASSGDEAFDTFSLMHQVMEAVLSAELKAQCLVAALKVQHSLLMCHTQAVPPADVPHASCTAC
jgi:hypothetical protein